MICSCGWRCRTLQRLKHRLLIRAFFSLCWINGHKWGPDEEVHCGPVDFEESEDTKLGSFRQCQQCYKTEQV
jgi:hypothetical protein